METFQSQEMHKVTIEEEVIKISYQQHPPTHTYI